MWLQLWQLSWKHHLIKHNEMQFNKLGVRLFHLPIYIYTSYPFNFWHFLPISVEINEEKMLNLLNLTILRSVGNTQNHNN